MIRGCTWRSILRRGSRFNASDLSYNQPRTSAARTADEVTTAVAEVLPRGRDGSTDVASRVALLASIPLARCDTSPSRRPHYEQSLEEQREADDHEDLDEQHPALVTEHANQSADVQDRCRSVSFDDEAQQFPNTNESRQVSNNRYINVSVLIRTKLPNFLLRLSLNVPVCDCMGLLHGLHFRTHVDEMWTGHWKQSETKHLRHVSRNVHTATSCLRNYT